jgi:uncharacterized protein YhaN
MFDNKRAVLQITRMIGEMPYITEHISGLRQEINDLQNMNVRYAGKHAHSEIDQTALEIRTNRLREIKQELSKMLDRPQDPKVWWEKFRKTNAA